MTGNEIDLIKLNFDPTALKVINIIIGFIMFGVALDIKVGDFVEAFRKPKAPAIGLICQFLLLPAISFGIISIFNPPPSISLGVLLIASCPGGNMSNFLTSFSGGNSAISIIMSSTSTVFSVIMTPLNFTFWANMRPDTAKILQSIHIDPLSIFFTVLTILIIPTILGMTINYRFPVFTKKVKPTLNKAAFIVFIGFILGAIFKNADNFKIAIGHAFFIVLVTNALALLMGYYMAKFWGLDVADRKAVSFEIGIQNAAFSLILVFNFFDGLGGMAIICAWYGVWHAVTGLSLSCYWHKRDHITRKKNITISPI